MSEAAIKAAYHDYKRVLGRKVLQIILEVPLEQESDVHAKIGYPSPDGSTWVALARLSANAEMVGASEKSKRQWSDMPRSKQAGIAAKDPEFVRYLWAAHRMNDDATDEAVAQFIRLRCGVSSRANLDTMPTAGDLWDKLYSDYQLWKRGAAA